MSFVRGGVWALVALALALTPAAWARADQPATVLLLYARRPAQADPIRAELGAAGFAVVARRARRAAEVAGELAQAARDTGAAAALALGTSALPIWLYMRAGDELSAHTPPPQAQSDDAALAIYATELVRARLLAPTEPQPPSAHAEDDVTDSTAAAVAAPRNDARGLAAPAPAARADSERRPPQRPWLSAELGPALLYAPGGLAPQATLSFAMMARVGRVLRVGLLSLIPLHNSELSAPEGTSKTRLSWLGAELRSELRLTSALRASLAGGAGMIILASEGTSGVSGFLDGQVRRFSAGAYLGMGAIFPLTAVLALRLEGRVGALLNPFAIQYALRPAARWGLPWLAATLDLQWSFY